MEIETVKIRQQMDQTDGRKSLLSTSAPVTLVGGDLIYLYNCTPSSLKGNPAKSAEAAEGQVHQDASKAAIDGPGQGAHKLSSAPAESSSTKPAPSHDGSMPLDFSGDVGGGIWVCLQPIEIGLAISRGKEISLGTRYSMMREYQHLCGRLGGTEDPEKYGVNVMTSCWFCNSFLPTQAATTKSCMFIV
jgi:hypothetical protein